MTDYEIKEKLKVLETFNPVKSFKNEWIKMGLTQEVIIYTDSLGFYLCKYKSWLNKNKHKTEYGINSKTALTNSQIRNVYGEVKRIQQKLIGQPDQEKAWEDTKSAFLLLQPKLAYAAGRVESKNRNSAINSLQKILTSALLGVRADDKEASLRFQNFVDFFESVLAYHKTYGGKNN